jgi:hypothetical protein
MQDVIFFMSSAICMLIGAFAGLYVLNECEKFPVIEKIIKKHHFFSDPDPGKIITIVVLIYAMDTCVFGFLAGLIVLTAQVLAASLAGIICFIGGIVFKQLLGTTLEIKNLANKFWRKQFRLL